MAALKQMAPNEPGPRPWRSLVAALEDTATELDGQTRIARTAEAFTAKRLHKFSELMRSQEMQNFRRADQAMSSALE